MEYQPEKIRRKLNFSSLQRLLGRSTLAMVQLYLALVATWVDYYLLQRWAITT